MIPGRQSERDGIEREISIDVDKVVLEGTLGLPSNPLGVVLFAHGSGSSRHSSRNRYVANVLQLKGIATLLFDLLTREEESVDQRTAELRFDIGLLANCPSALGSQLVGQLHANTEVGRPEHRDESGRALHCHTRSLINAGGTTDHCDTLARAALQHFLHHFW